MLEFNWNYWLISKGITLPYGTEFKNAAASTNEIQFQTVVEQYFLFDLKIQALEIKK
jgi:hypothetical protein